MPSVIRPFIAPDQLRWLDHAEWNSNEDSVEWRFETTTFTGLYTCGGKNYIRDLGDGTCEVHIAGHLNVQGDKLPNVPRLLGRKLAPTIEKWVVGNVTPNIAAMLTACQLFLDGQSRLRLAYPVRSRFPKYITVLVKLVQARRMRRCTSIPWPGLLYSV